MTPSSSRPSLTHSNSRGSYHQGSTVPAPRSMFTSANTRTTSTPTYNSTQYGSRPSLSHSQYGSLGPQAGSAHRSYSQYGAQTPSQGGPLSNGTRNYSSQNGYGASAGSTHFFDCSRWCLCLSTVISTWPVRIPHTSFKRAKSWIIQWFGCWTKRLTPEPEHDQPFSIAEFVHNSCSDISSTTSVLPFQWRSSRWYGECGCSQRQWQQHRGAAAGSIC